MPGLTRASIEEKPSPFADGLPGLRLAEGLLDFNDAVGLRPRRRVKPGNDIQQIRQTA
jgi:hypothetical protein